MARRRIRFCTGVEPERWDPTKLGNECARVGCRRTREGYLTAIRPADHPVGQLWYAGVCAPCAAQSLMKPFPLELVLKWMGGDTADVAIALNIPEAEVAARLAA